MALWTWWTGDALPALPPIEGFAADFSSDVGRLSGLTGLAPDEVVGRLFRLLVGGVCHGRQVTCLASCTRWTWPNLISV